MEDANIREFYEYQILSEDFELAKDYKDIEHFSFYLTYSIRENMGKSENNGPEIYSLHGEINIEDIWELILGIRWVFYLRNIHNNFLLFSDAEGNIDASNQIWNGMYNPARNNWPIGKFFVNITHSKSYKTCN